MDQYEPISENHWLTRVEDPADRLLAAIGESSTAMVLGEFGMGKTTHAERFGALTGLPVLFLPAALVDSRVTSTKDIIEKCLTFLPSLGFPEELARHETRLKRAALLKLLRQRTTPLVLVIDGLDESAFLARRGGLQQLFNALWEIQVPVVLTMRSEFWQSRQADLFVSMGPRAAGGPKRPQSIRLIRLLPWNDELMSSLVDLARTHEKEALARTHLDELKQVFDQGQYPQLYGDIPRRPLFLRMLIDETRRAGVRHLSRARLVRDWAWAKLRRDILQPLRMGGEGRLAIAPNLSDLDDAVDIAWAAMRAAARTMVDVHDGEVVLLARCSYDSVRKAVVQLDHGDLLPLSLNSLLLPEPRIPGRPLEIRFAHRAFQEYFLAESLLEEPWTGPPMPKEVMMWLAEIGAVTSEVERTPGGHH